MRIIFFGTPEIARIVLERLATDKLFKPVCVVTSPDEPIGRNATLVPSPVKQCAQAHDIPVLQPEKIDADFLAKIRKFAPDLFIVVAYGKIFPQTLLNIPQKGSINVHFSLLPLWRGASPIQHAILHGDTQIGTTLMLMDEKLDHGPILAQKTIPMPADATTSSLGKKLAKLSADLLCETIPAYVEGKLQAHEQNHKEATRCNRLRKEDGHIDWSLEAQQIERMIRAFTPWPGTYTFWEDKRIKIHRSHVLEDQNTQKEPGTVVPYKHAFAIQTGRDFLLPSIVQIEGKEKASAETFLRGYPAIIGSILQ